MPNLIQYNFSAKIWQYNGPNGWYFVSLPESISKEIRDNLKWQEEGWGRLKATAKINTQEWKTAIWFDTKANTYLLPLKAEIRKKCNLEKNQVIEVSVLV
ncbi:MAG: DUF1905 domain-containing protein [Bacteroidota bacterium]